MQKKAEEKVAGYGNWESSASKKEAIDSLRRAVFLLRKNSPDGGGVARLLLPLVGKRFSEHSQERHMEKGAVKKKMPGRPKLAETKTTTVGIRLSEKERLIIREKAKSAGLRPTTYMRQVIIDGKVKPRATEEQRLWIRQLVGMANNMNQVAKACHQQGVVRAMGYFQKFGSQMEEVLQKLTR